MIWKKNWKKSEEAKRELELYIADVVDDHKIKMDAMAWRVERLENMPLNNETWYHYAIEAMVSLVAILIAFVVTFNSLIR